MKTIRQFHPEQTPAQRKVQEKIWQRQDEDQRTLCEANLFWMHCREKPCRRARKCSGDPHACFRRHWDPLPEEERVFRRSFIQALCEGKTWQEALAFAAERRDAAAAFFPLASDPPAGA